MLKILELRKEKGVTQTELGNAIGVGAYTISKWERGKFVPDIESLIALANYFECSIDYLVGREDDFGNITVNKSITSENEKILDKINKLPEEKRKIVLSLIDTL